MNKNTKIIDTREVFIMSDVIFFNYNSVFSSRLRELLYEAKISKHKLSKEIGVSRQAISQYCDGSTVPNADKLLKIADYLGVSLDYLVGKTANKTPFDKPEGELIRSVCDYTGLNESKVNVKPCENKCAGCFYKQVASDLTDRLNNTLDVLEQRENELRIAKTLLQAYETRGESDAVSVALFEQVKWERDAALKTLEEHGIGLGQKTTDVEAKHGEWHLIHNCANEGVYCSVCNKKVYKTDYANQKIKSPYCPNCGAKMDKKASAD